MDEERKVAMNSSRGSGFALFAVLVMAMAYASGATAQSHYGQAPGGRYDSMQDFGPGLERPMITLIQEKLNEFGYRVPVTGYMTSRTVEAIRRYQQDAGMPVTGRADQELANQLNFGPEVRNNRTAWQPPSRPARPRAPVATAQPVPAPVDPDAGSPQVRWVQEKLAAAGYAPGAIDGMPGRRTTDAINRFRQDRGLPPGDIDNGLIAALSEG